MMEKQREQQLQEQQQQQRVVVVVHSQVRRIKQEEDERAKVHETYHQHRRLVLRDLDRQRSRSPLGRAAARTTAAMISIGGAGDS